MFLSLLRCFYGPQLVSTYADRRFKQDASSVVVGDSWSKLETFLLEQSTRIQMEICKRSGMKNKDMNREKNQWNTPLKIKNHLKKMIKITMNHKDPDQSTDLLVEADDLGLYWGVELSAEVGCWCRCFCCCYLCCFSPKPMLQWRILIIY